MWRATRFVGQTVCNTVGNEEMGSFYFDNDYLQLRQHRHHSPQGFRLDVGTVKRDQPIAVVELTGTRGCLDNYWRGTVQVLIFICPSSFCEANPEASSDLLLLLHLPSQLCSCTR
jgi:hypothetical protein